MMQGYQPMMQTPQGVMMRNAMGGVVLLPYPSSAPAPASTLNLAPPASPQRQALSAGDSGVHMLGLQPGLYPGGRPGYSGVVRSGESQAEVPREAAVGASASASATPSPAKLSAESIAKEIPIRWATKATLKVIDAKGLPEDTCGAFVTLQVLGSDEDELTTATKWREASPFWAETFTLCAASVSSPLLPSRLLQRPARGRCRKCEIVVRSARAS